MDYDADIIIAAPKTGLPVFTKAVHDSGLGELPTTRISSLLRSRHIFDNDLVNIFQLLIALNRVSPQFMWTMSTSILSAFLLNWSKACQQQICSGDQTITGMSTYAYGRQCTPNVLNISFDFLR